MSAVPSGGTAWIVSLAQGGTWLCAFVLLAAGRYVFEQQLTTRFRRRPSGWDSLLLRARVSYRTSPVRTAMRVGALITALLGGAAIPLGPPVQIGTWHLPFHLFDSADIGLLYVLAMEWVSASLLALAQEDQTGGRTVWHTLGSLLLHMLPLTLIAVNLALTAGALAGEGEGTLKLPTWIDLQEGGRWMAIFQALLLVGWMIYAAPPRTGPHMQTTLVRQIQCLNMALLTGAVFLGGWHGPFVLRFPGLGLVYTSVKTGFVSFVWAWAWASLPQPGLVSRTGAVWRVAVPIVTLNILATALVVVA